MSAVGFLHTSPVHVPTFEALVAERLPGVTAHHHVDPSLLDDARRDGPAAVAGRIAGALAVLADAGAVAICCTCSTIGAVAEAAVPSGARVPVVRVDRPMARLAVAAGPRIVAVAALASTLDPTRELLADEARRAGVDARIAVETAAGAWDRFEADDVDGYLDAVTGAVRRLAPRADVVVLAQASMAPAAARCVDLPVPVLASPAPAVDHLGCLLTAPKT